MAIPQLASVMANPMAARRHLEKNKKATVSAASGSVTALSPKS